MSLKWRFEEGIYVLHAFEQWSRRTPARDIEVGRGRLRDLLAVRRSL